MKSSIVTKLQKLADRYEELKQLLSHPEVTGDLNRFRDLSKEYAQLESMVQLFYQYQNDLEQLKETQLLLEDPEMQQLAKLEIKAIEEKIDNAENTLQLTLLPKDPHDNNNIFLEIRAGA